MGRAGSQPLFCFMWLGNLTAFVAVGHAGILIYRGPGRIESGK